MWNIVNIINNVLKSILEKQFFEKKKNIISKEKKLFSRTQTSKRKGKNESLNTGIGLWAETHQFYPDF